jgi:hypothetical protein
MLVKVTDGVTQVLIVITQNETTLEAFINKGMSVCALNCLHSYFD